MPIYGKTYVVFYEFINFKRKKVLLGHFFTHSNIAVQTRIQTLGLGGLEPKNLIKNFVQIFFSSNLGHFLLKIQPFWPKYYIFPPNFLPFGGGLEPGIHSLFGVWGGLEPRSPPPCIRYCIRKKIPPTYTLPLSLVHRFFAKG